MLQDPLTLYKLIVLYMLDRVNFPMTNAQVSDYILEKEYTNYLTLQQVINELTEAHMIAQETIRNRTHLSITAEGRETLRFFRNLINYGIKQDIDNYFRENEYVLRNEVSVLGDYYYTARAGGYEAIWWQRTKISIWWTSGYPCPRRKLPRPSATNGRRKIRKSTNTWWRSFFRHGKRRRVYSCASLLILCICSRIFAS